MVKKAEDSVIVALDKEELIINDKKYIKKIINDLLSIHDNKIDLRDHISSYIENISTIHQYLRDKMKNDYLKSKKNIEDTLEEYSIIKVPVERQIQKMLYVYKEDEENERIHIETISDSVIRNIDYLQDHNKGEK